MSLTSCIPVKCLIVGDGAVGKTCLLQVYATGTFSDEYIPTIFDNYSALVRLLPDDKIINLSLWDSAGQSEFSALRCLSYPQTGVFLLCYSLISPVSLDNIKAMWYPEIKHFNPHTPFVLVGTRADQLTDPQILSRLKEKGLQPNDPEKAHQIGRELGAYASLIACAKTGEGLKEVFETAIRAYLDSIAKEDTRRKEKHGCILI